MIVRIRIDSIGPGDAEPDEGAGALPGGGLGYALAAAAHGWRAELGEALADLAVTPAQFFVLAALLHRHRHESQAPTQRKLAELSGMDPNTTSQVVRGLERRGIVLRERHAEDSRSMSVALTDEGLALTEESAARARALNDKFFAGVDAPALFELLTGLAAASRERGAAERRA
jgi:DNA-binding MarR family transcriptional regulator